MSYAGYTRAESMCCNRCKQYIRWNETDIGDMFFSGVMYKLKHHQENDKECVRIQKLSELFDEKTDLLGAQKYL